MMSENFSIYKTLLVVVALAWFTGCTAPAKKDPKEQATLDSLKNQIKELTAGHATIEKHLIAFDTLDFTVFTNQQWARLHESHSQDIKVNLPDGHSTKGIVQHINDLKAMFFYAPNTSIKEHSIRFGSGNMTCVTGAMTGTFSAPMPIGNGKFIPPTGKSFSLPMCTVGIWKDGVMTEEFLFWDNQAYMNQVGLGNKKVNYKDYEED